MKFLLMLLSIQSLAYEFKFKSDSELVIDSFAPIILRLQNKKEVRLFLSKKCLKSCTALKNINRLTQRKTKVKEICHGLKGKKLRAVLSNGDFEFICVLPDNSAISSSSLRKLEGL